MPISVMKTLIVTTGFMSDGIELSSSFDVDTLPRIGERVLIPSSFQHILQPDHSLPIKRFAVVHIDHHWSTFMSPRYSVYISTLKDTTRITKINREGSDE